MINKKGLSAVVTTLIMILLALVAIGMIWLVVTNILGDTTGRIDDLTKCIDAKIKVTAVNCAGGGNSSLCDVSLYNDAGGKLVDGVRLVFYNSSGVSPTEVYSDKDVGELKTVTETNLESGVNYSNKVEAYVYVEDASGKKSLCEQPVSTLTY